MVVVFDLDDTLYDEVDFVKSGFAEVASYLRCEACYGYMWEYFCTHGSGRVFDALIAAYDLDVPLQKLIEIYRFHTPRIALSSDWVRLLETVQPYPTALITDGHYVTQRNKFEALRLQAYIRYPIFTDAYRTSKPDTKPYEAVMRYFKDETNFVYVADNPARDFAALEPLGWRGIRYKNPNGIYRDVPLASDVTVEVSSVQEIGTLLQRLVS